MTVKVIVSDFRNSTSITLETETDEDALRETIDMLLGAINRQEEMPIQLPLLEGDDGWLPGMDTTKKCPTHKVSLMTSKIKPWTLICPASTMKNGEKVFCPYEEKVKDKEELLSIITKKHGE